MIQKHLHWADEKEIVTSRPLKVMLFFVRLLPICVSLAITHCVAILFFIFSKRAKIECRRYQNQMKAFDPHFTISLWTQIVSFSLTLVEKIEGWLGRLSLKNISFFQDDIKDLRSRLETGKGAVIICSHEGNSEMLRGLANWNRTGVSHRVPVVSVMDTKSTANFNKMLEHANIKYSMNIVDADNITPATICTLQDCVDKGGLVVIAGDRTANKNRNRVFLHNFLGQSAPFAFGAFYMPLLLGVPVYFFFALRKKDYGLFVHYDMHVHKTCTPIPTTKKQRLKAADALCSEFCSLLENYVKQKPYQWYNFFDFWALPQECQQKDKNLQN